jgi:hypothetical protein
MVAADLSQDLGDSSLWLSLAMGLSGALSMCMTAPLVLKQPRQEHLMNTIRQDFTRPALIEAIEANTNEFLLALGRAGGGEERDEPAIQWIIGGAPIAYHNCVVRADLPTDRVDEAIVASIERFQAYHVPGSWHVGPAMRPETLGERLLAHGLSYAGEEPGMAVDLLALQEEEPGPSGVVIERVRDEPALGVWISTLAQGFGEGEIEANWVGAMYRQIGLGDQALWRHYLGRLHGEPVATTTLFLALGWQGSILSSPCLLPAGRALGRRSRWPHCVRHKGSPIGLGC